MRSDFPLATRPTAQTTTIEAFASSLWSFDGDTLDSWSNRHAAAAQPTFYTTDVFSGTGTALIFTRESQQYLQINTYHNLSYRSFTVELWFYCTLLSSGSYGFFAQHDASQNFRSLHIEIRNFFPYFGFYDLDLRAQHYIKENIWYHIAFVYDIVSQVRIIYLNGQQVARGSCQPFQGRSGAITIGKTQEYYNLPTYFNGYLDEVSLVMRAKSPEEIEDAALGHLGPDRLVSWHSFDNGSLTDRAQIPLPAVAGGISYVTGRVNQAIRFSSISSFYQISGFRLLGQANFPYSMSLWVKRSSVAGATLIHSSTETDGTGWCIDYLGFSSSGNIVASAWEYYNRQQIVGPNIPHNQWAHITTTYSATNGLRLFVDGSLIGTTGPKLHEASGLVNILTLGNSIQGEPDGSPGGTCNSQSIDPRVYFGEIDEFRIYARELSGAEVLALANP